jgi:hypothetical protein
MIGRITGFKKVTISTHQIGQLILTSGRIIVCDPLIVPDTRYHLKKTIKPGHYPVVAGVHKEFKLNSPARIGNRDDGVKTDAQEGLSSTVCFRSPPQSAERRKF